MITISAHQNLTFPTFSVQPNYKKPPSFPKSKITSKPINKIQQREMELAKDEVKKFIMVWISVVISLCYCYTLSKTTKKGLLRLTLILPVIILFLLLPLNLSSVHLTGTTSFFVSWLSTFKLLLFSLGLGPLSSLPPLSLPYFISFACLPIKLRPQSSIQPHPSPRFSIYILKLALLALMVKFYEFGDRIHPQFLWLVYFFHIYFMLELILAIVAGIANLLLGIELEPQFNDPLLSSSLQDFWGKRWNLMVTRILRPTVYDPVLDLSTRFLGRERAALPAVMATFVVSGAMHELIFYYMGRVRPTFEVSAFFLLHGVCLCLEIVLKRAIGGAWRPPRVVSGAATVVFVMGTGFWLFLPPMLRWRLDERAFEEYAAVGAYVRGVGSRVFGLTRLS